MFFRRPVKSNLGTTRIEAFSDSIFAFAVTLLILNLTVPELSRAQVARGELAAHLIAQWPTFLIYAMSFSILAIFWVGHTIMFHYIKKTDRTLLWLNNILLMTIAFMPFPTDLLGLYAPDQTAVVLYGVTAMATGLMFVLIWWYASSGKRFVEAGLSDRIIKKGMLAVSLAPIVYLVAIGLSFINPLITIGIYIAIPVLYIIPSPIDELLEG